VTTFLQGGAGRRRPWALTAPARLAAILLSASAERLVVVLTRARREREVVARAATAT